LLRAGHTPETVETVLDRLASERALDDDRLASTWARARLSHYGHGRHRIKAELLRRGVARPSVERGLRQALDDVPETAALDATLRRLWRHQVKAPAEKRLLRVWNALLRRGYPAQLVAERLRALHPQRATGIAELVDSAAGYGHDDGSDPSAPGDYD